MNSDIAVLAESIHALARQMTAEKRFGKSRLISIEEISELMQMSRASVVKSVITRPGFPQDVRPTGNKNGDRRWFLDEVETWLRKNRGAA